MTFASALVDGNARALVVRGRTAALVSDLVPQLDGDLLDLIRAGCEEEVSAVADKSPDAFGPIESFRLTAPYRYPRMVLGIGLNYVEHASDLSATAPQDEPASFIKGDHTVIGPGDAIPLPEQSRRVTAEAELGLVIGRECRNVSEEEALDYVFGVCTVLDQTAEDILQRNPRFLTRAKNFPGFFSFGPTIVPVREVLAEVGSLDRLEVSTLVNGAVHRSNVVANMTFSPQMLISFHSKVMPLMPGDILSTGTPGAAVIEDGDVAGCRIPHVGELFNPVVRAA